MSKWFFSPSFTIEGPSDPGVEMFKGEPIRAMAREACQNSLDAKYDESKPLRVEIERYYIRTKDFPGIEELKEILVKCSHFWAGEKNEQTRRFIDKTISAIKQEKIYVLRISDYNTTGLTGAYDARLDTPWKGLVQGKAFCVKQVNDAAGAFGIGKYAPFAVSQLHTLFYRTYDVQGVRAVQGVTHLVSFREENDNDAAKGIKSSSGYYSDGIHDKPFQAIELLDKLNKRNEYGTDLFILGFDSWADKGADWKSDIIIELLENFLYSLYSGKMEVKIDDTILNKNNLSGHIKRFLPKTKHADSFLKVIEENERVVSERKNFHNMGYLNLRLLYYPDAIKKILVVRKSGMKIADISALPKAIPFVGFLELEGKDLNTFFRNMENPQHNAWEPKRHPNEQLARKYKNEIEEWVRETILEKVKENIGEEIDIDVNAFFATENEDKKGDKSENIVDKVKEMTIIQDEPTDRKFNVKDIGGQYGKPKDKVKRGRIDDEGPESGHRQPTGKKGGSPTGRKGVVDDLGNDSIYDKMHEVNVSARIIKGYNRSNKLIFIPDENIVQGEIEIVTIGENGKNLRLNIKSIKGINVNAWLQDGHIVISSVESGKKSIIEFEIFGQTNYAMGVRAYGN